MDLVIKKNALVVPQTLYKDFGAGMGQFAHGVVRDQGDPDYFAHMRNGKAFINEKLQTRHLQEQPEKLAGKWLYLGGLHNHFGHFLAECIHRIWAWHEYRDQCSGVLFLPNIKQFELGHHLPGYSKAILDFLGLEESAIRYVTQLTEVEELLVPEPGSQLFVAAKADYIKFLATLKLAQRLHREALPSGYTPKVFVSRKKYRMNGSIAGLDVLENSLQQEGYFIFYPENYPIAIQLKVYQEAEKIIFEEGSAVHLLELFAKIKADVLLIKRRPSSRSFDCVFKPRTKCYIKYIDVMTPPPLTSAKFADVNALSLTDLDNLGRFLVTHGFASAALAIPPDWRDKVKADILGYLLKNARLESPSMDEFIIDYLQSIDDFFQQTDKPA